MLPYNSRKTLLLIVKLTAIILLTSSLQVSARTTAQRRVTFAVKGVSLEKLFSEDEKCCGYTILYYAEAPPFGTFPVKMAPPDAAKATEN
jgi:hypothetical protein